MTELGSIMFFVVITVVTLVTFYWLMNREKA